MMVDMEVSESVVSNATNITQHTPIHTNEASYLEDFLPFLGCAL